MQRVLLKESTHALCPAHRHVQFHMFYIYLMFMLGVNTAADPKSFVEMSTNMLKNTCCSV